MRNAGSSAIKITIGTAQLQNVFQQLDKLNAHQNQKTQIGTITEQTASLHRHGTVRSGILQTTHQLTIQRQEYADTNVPTATTLKTAEQAVFPTQKQVLLVLDCR